jgi:hypothetical protein
MREEDSMKMERRRIREQIKLAFKCTAPPEASQIVASSYPEPLQIRDFFKGRNWWDVTLDILVDEYVGDASACLSFMAPVGMRYYLPAYLFIACEQYDEGDVISKELPSRLLMYARDDDLYKIKCMDDAKQAAVAQVLEFLVQAYDDEDAYEALEFFWGKFL